MQKKCFVTGNPQTGAGWELFPYRMKNQYIIPHVLLQVYA